MCAEAGDMEIVALWCGVKPWKRLHHQYSGAVYSAIPTDPVRQPMLPLELQGVGQISREGVTITQGCEPPTCFDKPENGGRIVCRMTKCRLAKGEMMIVGTRVPGPHRSIFGGAT